MSKHASRFRKLLPFLIVVAALVSAPPVSQPQASAFCEPPSGGCIEYTVFNEQTCRCECPNQDCCDFYFPWVPYGCEGESRSKTKATPGTVKLTPKR